MLSYANKIGLGLLLVSSQSFGAQVATLASGAHSSCALFGDGTMKCWGYGGVGNLGQGDSNDRGDQPGSMGAQLLPISLGTGAKVLQMSMGDYHVCAMLGDHSVKCWGYNNSGQLGTGDTNNRGDQSGSMGDALVAVNLGTGRTALAIAAGGYFNCALLDDHSVRCWGANDQGQLGLGSTVATIGAAAGQMGDALVPVSLGTGRTAVDIRAGEDYACALLDDKELKCWGDNSAGQLGLGDTNNRGNQAGSMGDALTEIDLGAGRTVSTFTLSYQSVCATLDNGDLKCWGGNSDGQLGLDDVSPRGISAGQMGAALPPVVVEPDETPSAVSCGGTTCCATFAGPGTLKCWGGNGSGQLGQGDTVSRGGKAGDMGLGLPFVDVGPLARVSQVSVSKQGIFGCAILDDASVRCWGYNSYGELGLGDSNNRGDVPGEMDSALPAVQLQ